MLVQALSEGNEKHDWCRGPSSSNKRQARQCCEVSVLSPQAQQGQATVWERTDSNSSNINSENLEQQTEKIGVLLLNLGGPETLDDVRPFLYNLFNDDSIIRLPAQGDLSS